MLCDVVSSKRIFEEEYTDKGVPFIRGQEVSDATIDDENFNDFECYISESRYEQIVEQYGSPNKGDILITAVGTIGNVLQLSAQRKFYFKDGNILWLKNFSREVDSSYLYYYLQSPFFKKILNYSLIGAVQKALTISKLSQLEVILPDLLVQKRIGSFFSNIDKKIQNNKRQIETLGSIAKTIYDYWFVQFDFPNEEGKPYKSSGGKMVLNEELKREIPEGWNETSIGKITNCLDSKRIPLSGKQRELKKGNIPYYGATSIMGFVDEFIFDGDFVLMAEDGSIMTSQNTPILQRISGKSWVNNHAHVIEPKGKYSCSIIFQFLKNVYVPSLKTGSIQAKITQNKMNSIKVVNIPDAFLEKYNETIEPIDKIIKLSNEEISILNKVKESLLPLIMSGQVSLK